MIQARSNYPLTDITQRNFFKANLSHYVTMLQTRRCYVKCRIPRDEQWYRCIYYFRSTQSTETVLRIFAEIRAECVRDWNR